MADPKTQLQQALAATAAASGTSVTRPKRKRGPDVKTPVLPKLRAQGGPAAHKQSVRRAKELRYRAARAALIWDLHSESNLTFRQCGEAIANYEAPDGTKFQKVSDYTAHTDFTSHARMLLDRFPETTEQKRLAMAARANRRRRTLVPQAFGQTCPHCGAAKPDKDALRLLQEEDTMEARLFGLFQQKEGSFSGEQVGEMIMLFMRGVLAIDAFRTAMRDQAVNRQAQDLLLSVTRRLPDVPAVGKEEEQE